MNAIRRILHRHEWEMTHGNGYYIATQEICKKCGEYRHRTLAVGSQESEKWKPGKHPKSE